MIAATESQIKRAVARALDEKTQVVRVDDHAYLARSSTGLNTWYTVRVDRYSTGCTCQAGSHDLLCKHQVAVDLEVNRARVAATPKPMLEDLFESDHGRCAF